MNETTEQACEDYNEHAGVSCTLPDWHAGQHEHRRADGSIRATWHLSEELPTLDAPTDEERGYLYRLEGGPNYSNWFGAGESVGELGTLDWNHDAYRSLGDALNAWIRRRNDWTGRFPCWGDGMALIDQNAPDDDTADYIIFLGDETETVEGWTLLGALEELGRADELGNYVDLPEDEELGR